MIFRRRNPEEQPSEPNYGDGAYADHFAEDGVYVGAGYAEDTLSGLNPDVDTAVADPAELPDGGYVPYVDVAPHLEELARLQHERGALIELCIYARDRVNSPAAAERIDAGLVALGITPLRPDGEQFDPAQHEAAASVPTTDPGLHGRVAETEVPGYADRGRMVRPPVVAVYRQEQV